MKTYRGLNLPVQVTYYYSDDNMGSDVYEVFTLSDKGARLRMGVIDKLVHGQNKGVCIARAFSLSKSFPTLRVAAKAILREFVDQQERGFPGDLWK